MTRSVSPLAGVWPEGVAPVDVMTRSVSPLAGVRPEGVCSKGLPPVDAVPRRPRLLDGMVVVALPDGILFEGTARREVLRGRAATSMLPALIGLLDGTRSIEQVTAALDGVPSAHVHRAVAMLWSLGLIEEATDEDATDAVDIAGPLGAYLGRLIGTADGRPSTAEVLRRIHHAHVLVAADEVPGALVGSQLVACGLSQISAVPPVGAMIAEHLRQATPVDLLVVVEHSMDHGSLEEIARRCAEANVRWLRTAVLPAGGEVGPLFGPHDRPCYHCFSTHAGAGVLPPRSTDEADPLLTEAWAALVAIEVLYVVGGIGSSVSAGQVAVFDLDRWEEHRIQISCPHPTRGPLPDRRHSERR